jgi:hypothetical protein
MLQQWIRRSILNTHRDKPVLIANFTKAARAIMRRLAHYLVADWLQALVGAMAMLRKGDAAALHALRLLR